VSATPHLPPSTVAQLEARLGANWPNLTEARTLSQQVRVQLTTELAGIDSADTSIVVSGSLARDEFTRGSNIDWTLLIDGIADPSHQELLDRIMPIIARHAGKDPGREGTFGEMAFSHHLVHQIGGEDDTNRNTTRRLLLLLESSAVGRPEAYDRVVNNVLQRYISEDDGFTDRSARFHVPRFLQNDFARYWRTVAVDFAYKRRRRSGSGAAMRNLKLRMSRKLLYVSGLLTCFSCELKLATRSDRSPCAKVATTPECVACLRESMRRSPLEILATVVLAFEHLRETGRTLFDAYDGFLGMLSDKATRDCLEKLPAHPGSNDPLWARARSLSHQFRDGLIELFFDQESGLADLTRIYGVF
jgi:hypothetical protein